MKYNLSFTATEIRNAYSRSPIGTEKYNLQDPRVLADLNQAIELINKESKFLGTLISNNLMSDGVSIPLEQLTQIVRSANPEITNDFIMAQLNNFSLFKGIHNKLNILSDKKVTPELINTLVPEVRNEIGLGSNDFVGTYLDKLMLIKEYIAADTIDQKIAALSSEKTLTTLSSGNQGNLYKTEYPRLDKKTKFFTDPTPNPVYNFVNSDVVTGYNIYSELFEHRDSFNPFVLLQSFYGYQSDMANNMTLFGTQISPMFLGYLLKLKLAIGQSEIEYNTWLGRRAYNAKLVGYDNPGLPVLDPTTLGRPASDADYNRMNGILALLDWGAAVKSDPFYNPIKLPTQGVITASNIQSILDSLIAQFATGDDNLKALYEARVKGQTLVDGSNTAKKLVFIFNSSTNIIYRQYLNTAAFKGTDYFKDTIYLYQGYEIKVIKAAPDNFIMLGQFNDQIEKSEIIITFNTFIPGSLNTSPFRIEPFANGQDGMWELLRFLFGVGLPKNQIVFYSTTIYNPAYPLRPVISLPASTTADLPLYN